MSKDHVQALSRLMVYWDIQTLPYDDPVTHLFLIYSYDHDTQV